MSNHDISGQKFGKLLVVKRAKDYIATNGRRRTQFLCMCECGKVKTVLTYKLTSGRTTSCGCSRGRPQGHGVRFCAFNPTAIMCDDISNCDKCGWNPHNTELHKERIMKLKRKDGTDE